MISMKKRVLLFSILLLLTTISLVSAQGLSDLLNNLDQSMVILFAIFLISFSLLFFSLNRVFRDNPSMAGIISVAISFLIIYGVNKRAENMGFNIEGFFFNIGISQEIIATILPIIIIAGMVFLIIKLKKDSLLVIGGLFILLSFFVINARLLLIVIGIILIAIRMFIPREKWKPKGKGFRNFGAGI